VPKSNLIKNKTFIGGYWKEPPETVYTITDRLINFLHLLQQVDEIFINLKLPAYSKKQAMGNIFEINTSTVLKELIKSRKKVEIDSSGFCRIGFSLNLFNETDIESVVISCTLGVSSKYVNNVCYVDFKGNALEEPKVSRVEYLIKEIFSPETITIK
jgi:hypothetical protein